MITRGTAEKSPTGRAATGVLLSGYLAHRAGVSRARGPLFLSESQITCTVWTDSLYWLRAVSRMTGRVRSVLC
jgi:integrase/recombinase XerD